MSLITKFRALPKVARTRWFWIAMGVAAMLLRLIFALLPQLTEVIYSRGIFVGVRYVLDYTLGLLPFPLFYLLLLGLITLVFWKVIRRVKKGPGEGAWGKRLLRTLHGLAAWTGGIVFFFLFLWGYNYQRIPVEEQLVLAPQPLTDAQVYAAAERAAHWLTESRTHLSPDTAALTDVHLPQDLPGAMRWELSQVLEREGFPTPGLVRVKPIWPGGLLMRFGVSGIYLPFTGQGCYPADMPTLDRPFTQAHELSHAMGFGDEGTCNFLAFLACEQSANPGIVYSGRLNYWSYISRDLYRLDPEAYENLRDSLPAGVRADLRVFRDYSRKYRSWMTGVGSRVNNSYLKSQGVQEGTGSYNRLVMLVEAWREAGNQ